MSDVVTRAELFIAKPVRFGIEWRAEALDTIRKLIDEVGRLEAVPIAVTFAAPTTPPATRGGDGPW